jgi:predicted nuclease with TOPRIM domain
MAYESQSSATSPSSNSRNNNDSRKIIYGLLILALLGTWGYIIWDKSKSNETITHLQSEYSNVDSSRNAIQSEYNDALARLDSATGNNTQLQGVVAERKDELDRLKRQITSITNNRNATAAELSRARGLINQLNMKIDQVYAEVERLRGENQTLTSSNQRLNAEKQQLSTEKSQLEENVTATESARREVEDVASTLHASNMNIAPINLKNRGKEKETSTAKRVDLLRISFELDENRIASSGSKELYVAVTAPDGRPVTMASGSGTFDTREDGTKTYTNIVTVPYEQGKRATVGFDWKQEGRYQLGEYKIEVYHNGFKIGEGKRSLKKGGIFG